MNKFKKIVLTGGPCAGKTKGVEFLKKELENSGIKVFVIKESAEKLISDGFDRTKSYDFQKQIAINQIEQERKYEQVADTYEKSVIICDRGLYDARVYLNDDEFELFKKELGLTDIQMRDRYDAAFHMDSMSGKTGYVNSKIRIENSFEANELNDLSLKVWCGNPHYRFIPVCESIDDKLHILLKEVLAFIGIPVPLEIERKFLIKMPDVKLLLSKCCSKVEINQHYLINNNNRFRIRSRGIGDDCIYTKTSKRRITDSVYEEFEDNISFDEFNDLLHSSEIEGSIIKDRYCLMENSKYYEIDVFPFWKNQGYLEIELQSDNEEFELPEFINIIEEVTDNVEYKNSSLCKKIPEEKI